MATIQKTSSKNWRITKMYKGRRYHLNVSRKPTKQEAEKLIWSLIEKEPEQCTYQSFQTAAQKYIESKSAVLSPSTLRAYQSMIVNTPQDFKKRSISALMEKDVQICINEYSMTHSGKSTRNLAGFISAVIKSVRPKFSANVTLPQKIKHDFYVPEDDDVMRILDYARGTRYEIPLWLAVFSLRRSEICALLTSDLDADGTLTINKAKVRGMDGKYIIKSTKTTDSTRKVSITPYVADLIRSLPDGEVYPYSPNQINTYLHRVEETLGIPSFSLHKLRHYFASTAREIMGDAYVEKLGGWHAGSDIMKKVYDYTKAKQEHEARAAYARRMSEFFERKSV